MTVPERIKISAFYVVSSFIFLACSREMAVSEGGLHKMDFNYSKIHSIEFLMHTKPREVLKPDEVDDFLPCIN